ncbi:hypothetical protein [Ancylobacter sp. TS-1]|uniref:hypothetical protein n=1 Tax=Ancylobacter sp. TS-1 TaxID=1850374 RepID=UPI001265BADC|nr:hypothetical protein [Ancylobacter sp. TS-1]QFR32427.1 hypothetical protein GBB76_04445 [Ancylobacter sp. TS-1]
MVNRRISASQRFLCAIAVWIFAAPALAGDLGGTPAEFGAQFNKVASSAGLKLRVAKSKCRDEGKLVCAFSSGDGLVILASSEAGSTSVRRVNLFLDAAAISDKTSGALEYITGLGVLMMIYAPKANKTERGIVVRSLARAGQSGAPVEEFLHDTRFEARVLPEQGLWVTVDRP